MANSELTIFKYCLVYINIPKARILTSQALSMLCNFKVHKINMIIGGLIITIISVLDFYYSSFSKFRISKKECSCKEPSKEQPTFVENECKYINHLAFSP